MVDRSIAIAALLGLCCASQLAAQELQVPDFVRLPGVYTTPKAEPQAIPLPNIKLVSQCVDDDPDLRTRGAALLALESSVHQESADVDALGVALGESEAVLRSERTVFDELVKGMRATDQALKEMSSSVKRLGKDSSTAAKVKQYNAAVDVYNAEVKKRNRQLTEVKRAQAAFTQKVDAHNAKIREQHRRIDEYNLRIAEFNKTANAFMSDVGKFDSDCLRPGEQ